MDGLLSITPGHDLTARWRRLREGDPFLSLGDAAARLDVVEAELLAAFCGDGALRLDGPFTDLVTALPTLGHVRAVTRNAHATIETRGTYPTPEVGCAGVAGEVGVRFLLDHWRYGYVLDGAASLDGITGFFFYDARGQAVHEIHADPATDRRVLARLVDLFASFDQSAGEEIVVASPNVLRPRPDTGAWFRGAEDARPVGPGAVATVLDAARSEVVPVSVAVRSPGVVHRFSGLLHDVSATANTVELAAPWVRVRIETARVAEAWIVRTPSLEGPVTSLEVFDARANVVLSVSAARWPGKPEPAPWNELLGRLSTVL
jgi:putative hemin transport protein